MIEYNPYGWHDEPMRHRPADENLWRICETPDFWILHSEDGLNLPYTLEALPFSKDRFEFNIYFLATNLAVTGILPIRALRALLHGEQMRTDLVCFALSQGRVTVDFPGLNTLPARGYLEAEDIRRLLEWLESEP